MVSKTRSSQLNNRPKHRRGSLWLLRQTCKFWHPILGSIAAITSITETVIKLLPVWYIAVLKTGVAKGIMSITAIVIKLLLLLISIR